MALSHRCRLGADQRRHPRQPRRYGDCLLAQTLYSSTKDHIHEFATLRALGSSRGYIYKVILAQAALSAIMGYVLGMVIALLILYLSRNSSLPLVMTPRFGILAFRTDAIHVRDLGAFGHRQGHEDRSGHGVFEMSTVPVMQAKNIVKELGSGAGLVVAVKGVSLELVPGELTLLMGPSGSGKTTLLSILGCIMKPTSGSIRIADTVVDGLSAEALAKIRREHIGFIFQSYNLFPTLNAIENVRIALDVRGIKGFAATSRSEEVLREVGLGHRLTNYPRNLSGGEQQRVAVARAIASSPSIVLADEPTAALDSENGHAVMALLSRIAKEQNCSVLAVTHDREPWVTPTVSCASKTAKSSAKSAGRKA